MRSCRIFSRSLRGSPLATALFLDRAEEAFAAVLRAVAALRADAPPRLDVAFTAAPRTGADLPALREEVTLFEGVFLDAVFTAAAFTAAAFEAVAFEAVAFEEVALEDAFEAVPFEAVTLEVAALGAGDFLETVGLDVTPRDAEALDAAPFDVAAFDAVLFDPTGLDAVAFDPAPFEVGDFDATAFDGAPFSAAPFVAPFEAIALAGAFFELTAFTAARAFVAAPRAGVAGFDAPLEEVDAAALRLLLLTGADDFLAAADFDAAPPRPFEVAIIVVGIVSG